jgi:hypothetical protein
MAWIFRARGHAQMTATPPEAKTEYSRGLRGLGGRRSAARGPSATGPAGAGLAVAAGAIAAAVVLIVAEFLPLYTLHIITTQLPAGSVRTGSHDAWALVPVALLAALLGAGPARHLQRPALLGLAALGVIVLVIALAVDLPDTTAHGLIHGSLLAATTTASGLYVETLGAVLLLLAGGGGLVAAGAGGAWPTRRGARPARGTAHRVQSRS